MADGRVHQSQPTIIWFRNDLRLSDNPALHVAIERGAPLLCIFVLETDAGLRPHGGASRWWLHHSLAALAEDLKKVGVRLEIFSGAAAEVVPHLAKAADAGALVFNRRYGGAATKIDAAIERAVQSETCAVEIFNGRLLNEPWDVKTKTGGAYGVFTPYWKAAQAALVLDKPLPRPQRLDGAPYPSDGPKRCLLGDLDLLPTKPNWARGLAELWTPGEAGAAHRLQAFIKHDLADYAEQRNRLASAGTSHLSPHLRFGEISPRQIFAAIQDVSSEGARVFRSEVGWREFDYHVLHTHPDVATKNLHGNFDRMPWRDISAADLRAWQTGQTGYPVVDAGMRQLWHTGYMHNRVRMIVASFLIKHLLCDWRVGEAWFWDTLCDADPANNALNWQWVAGSGADAAPFFRIFNPITQGEKFDPEGEYVRRWVLELAKLKGKVIHSPWTAEASELKAAGIELGKTYPKPMVDHKDSRERALQAYEKVKK